MDFDPVARCRFVPLYVDALWPLACLGLLLVTAALVSHLVRRHRSTGSGQQSVTAPGPLLVLRAHGLVVAIVLVCGVLTLVYHLRVTVPEVRAYLRAHPDASALMAAAKSEYRNDAVAWALGFSSASVAFLIRRGTSGNA